jgi:hypothetical protein
MVVIPVIVTPSPVFLLVLAREPAKIAVAVAVGLIAPSVVVNDLLIVPHVIIRVIRVIHAVNVVLGAC